MQIATIATQNKALPQVREVFAGFAGLRVEDEAIKSPYNLTLNYDLTEILACHRHA
jgi:hypothetical protein